MTASWAQRSDHGALPVGVIYHFFDISSPVVLAKHQLSSEKNAAGEKIVAESILAQIPTSCRHDLEGMSEVTAVVETSKHACFRRPEIFETTHLRMIAVLRNSRLIMDFGGHPAVF